MNHIEVFTQSSIRIEGDGRVIYFDPFRMKNAPHDADFIFITHDHYDHFSVDDIKMVKNDRTVLVVPGKLKGDAVALTGGEGKVRTVVPEETYDMEGLPVETIPAYNRFKPFHPKGAGWVGYIVTLEDERIYIAGDTDKTPENSRISCDVALVPIGGTYTMDARKAAQLINEIRPSTAIPTHYGSIVGRKEDGEVFRDAVTDDIRVSMIMQY